MAHERTGYMSEEGSEFSLIMADDFRTVSNDDFCDDFGYGEKAQDKGQIYPEYSEEG